MCDNDFTHTTRHVSFSAYIYFGIYGRVANMTNQPNFQLGSRVLEPHVVENLYS